MGLFDIFKPSPTSALASDGEKLFAIAKQAVSELTNGYKKLTDKGKYEVIIFNGFQVLRVFKNKYPQKYSAAEIDFFRALFRQAKEYKIRMSDEAVMNFINSRFQFYSREIENMYNSRQNDGTFIPANSYTAFYLTPLALNIEPYVDLFEIMRYLPGLVSMMRVVSVNSNKV